VTPSSNPRKLGVKDGDRVRAAGVPRTELVALLHDDELTFTLVPRGAADVVVRFVRGLRDVHVAAPSLRDAAGGRLWVAYEKGATRTARARDEEVLHRDTLQAALATHGLGIVTLVSLDDRWTAAWVRPT
jgi:hypothetical protein